MSSSDLPSGRVTSLFTDIEGNTKRWEQACTKFKMQSAYAGPGCRATRLRPTAHS